MSPKAAAKTEQLTSKRRKISGFDLAIVLLWIGVVVVFSIAGLRQNAPQEIKVFMTPGMLLIFYGLALVSRKFWYKYKEVEK